VAARIGDRKLFAAATIVVMDGRMGERR